MAIFSDLNLIIKKINELNPFSGTVITGEELIPVYDPATGKTVKVKASLFSGGEDKTLQWVSTETYEINEIRTWNLKFWKSEVDDNIGNQPTEGDYWTEVSKSETGNLGYWASGVFTNDPSYAVYNKQLYLLDNTVVTIPYESSNFETELAAGVWKLESITDAERAIIVAADAHIDGAIEEKHNLDQIGDLRVDTEIQQDGFDFKITNSLPYEFGTGFDDIVFCVAIQSDGKIICGGEFTTYKGESYPGIIRLNKDGSIDTTFVVGAGFNSEVYCVAIQDDGKIVVGGGFTTYKATSSPKIVRLDTVGDIDTTFIVDTGFDSFAKCIALQADGTMYIGGDFTTYKGTSSPKIVKLDSVGDIDSAFVVGTGFSGYVNDIAIQSDGKIIPVGYFTTYKGTSSHYIVRLDTVGDIDTTFIVGAGFNYYVYAVAIQDDGKIICGGDFITYQVSSSPHIIRINVDGSIDVSFTSVAYIGHEVTALAIQDDGKIICGGQIFVAGNQTINVIRYNTDGSIDTTFILGTGFDDGIHAVAIQDDGKIITVGAFTTYQGTSANNIIILTSTGAIATIDKTIIFHNGLAGMAEDYTEDLGELDYITKKYLDAHKNLAFAFSDETSDIVGSSTVPAVTKPAPFSFTYKRSWIYLGEAHTGSTFNVDVKKNGTSIFSTPITIDDGENNSLIATIPAVLTTFYFTIADKIEVFVTQAGSGDTGKSGVIIFDNGEDEIPAYLT
jgi:uncharacterized delta-60 repeat protein